MKPYDYQVKAGELLLSGKSVILQAPTGAGKTMAAILPYLHSWRDDDYISTFPGKCIYVVPMRVLAHQFINAYSEIADSIWRRFRRTLDVRILTGDQPDDKRFEGDLIFCTVDQFLSSYFTMPYSLPGRMANLNAGAMVGAYIVLDEFHLLDPGSTLPSMLYAVKQLRRLAPVLLMTATFSATMLDNLAKQIDAQVVLLSADEARRIETRSCERPARRRTWHVSDQLLSAAAVLNTHQSRSLALCNTVARAQALYRELRSLIEERGLDVRLLLLHSRFLPQDRNDTEKELNDLFGKDTKPTGSVIAIATQTIEVGVDITSEVLHTELAPASSLIQRAGRCARYPGEHGRVIVHAVESYMPYGRANVDPEKDDEWVKEMKAACVWLHQHDGEVLDFSKEQELVNAVATPRDSKVLMELSAGRQDRREAILRVLTGDQRQRQDQRLLVRDADSRRILIHSDPDQLLRNPFAATGFNLDLNTLRGMFKGWQERDANVDWRVKILVNVDADAQESNRGEYGWQQIHDGKLISGAQVLVVNPALAGYSREEGFVADTGDTGFEAQIPPDANAHTWENRRYWLESYEDHIQRVLIAYQEKVLPELYYPAHALDTLAGWAPGSVLRAAWLVCLMHDVGKLSTGWQGWAHAYQQKIGKPIPPDYAAAHTEYEWGNEVHRQAEGAIRARHPKPNHAAEGALAMSSIIANALGYEPLAKGAISAIVRHHTPFAKECQVFRLEPFAKAHIAATLVFLPQEVKQSIQLDNLKAIVELTPNSFPNLLARPDQDFEWLAYLVLTRALRRADQEGTAKGSSAM